MWQMWFTLWTHAGLTAQSVYLNCVASTLSGVASYGRILSADPALAPENVLRCPGCGAPLARRAGQGTAELPPRWLCCEQCRVCQLFTPPPQGTGGGPTPRGSDGMTSRSGLGKRH